MKQEIFKVTSKKLTEVILKEQKRKNNYMRIVTRKVKKVMPDVLAVSSSDNSWKSEIIPKALVLADSFWVKNKKSNWKKCEAVFFEPKAGKGRWHDTWWPKKNTNLGKELAKKIRAVMPSEEFFTDKSIAKALAYAPKKDYEETGNRTITATYLRFGYAKKKSSYTFMFSAYKGYKAPRGVKEILNSEYNALMAD